MTLLWLDPLTGSGYAFWSGVGGNIVLLGIFYSFYKDSRCHELKCHRRAWRTHPQHGYPVCHRHYPRTERKEHA